MQLPAYVLVPLCLLGQAFELTRAASILFTNAAIVTFNTSTSNTQLLHNSSILVEGDRISQIYNGTAPKSCPNGTEVVDATGKIISPGFINTHHHLWQTAFKTIASNTTLAEYFQRYGEFSPTVDNWTPEDKYLSQLTGALELLNAGTTTVLDHAHGDSSNEAADAIFNATLDSGLRTYHAFTIHQLPNNYTTQEQIKKLVELARDPRLTNSALVSLGLSYDFFDTSSTDMINRLWDIVQLVFFFKPLDQSVR